MPNHQLIEDSFTTVKAAETDDLANLIARLIIAYLNRPTHGGIAAIAKALDELRPGGGNLIRYHVNDHPEWQGAVSDLVGVLETLTAAIDQKVAALWLAVERLQRCLEGEDPSELLLKIHRMERQIDHQTKRVNRLVPN